VDFLLALLPVVTILVLMVGLGWPAARAGSAGLAVTLVVATAAFGYGTTTYGDIGLPRAVGGALLEAAFTTTTILWIVWPALALYHLQSLTGSFGVLQQRIAQLTRDPRIVALLVAWFLALFLEGAAGFGTPIALAAPFLVGAGFSPVTAVAIALVGHAAGVSFGAIGTPIVPQAAATGIAPLEIARATAPYHALVGWMLPLMVIAMVAPGTNAPASPRRRVWPWALLAAGLFIAPQFLIARLIGPELPTLGGALVGGVAFAFAWWRLGFRRAGRADGAAPPARLTETLRAAAPYLLVVGLILLTRLIPSIRGLLDAVAWDWTVYDRFGGAVQPLYHPGTILLTALVAAAIVQRARARDLLNALARAARQMAPVSLALVTMLGLSRLLVHAGMTGVLANSATAATGTAWPLFAPAVGLLGTFVTGSATASNILFTDLQVLAAGQAGMPVVEGVAAQGFGAAAGNMIAPHNVIAGAAAVGAAGREGEILRWTLLPCLLYVVVGGVVAAVRSAS
jgi:lactate permease